jgi:aryl-alcohol dehydrogenase-like predicted oxidoreductase
MTTSIVSIRPFRLRTRWGDERPRARGQGKVRHLGISEAGTATTRRAHVTHPLSAVQIKHSLWTRDVETEILPLCEEIGIGFVAYSPSAAVF